MESENDLNEFSDPDFVAAITSFVQNYGRDVSPVESRGLSTDMGEGEGVARSSQRRTGVDCVGTN
jgi:hypothetical protein